MQKSGFLLGLFRKGGLPQLRIFHSESRKLLLHFFKLCLPTGIDSGNFIASLLQKNGKFLYLLFMGCL